MDLSLQRVLSGYYMAVVTPQVMYLHSVQSIVGISKI